MLDTAKPAICVTGYSQDTENGLKVCGRLAALSIALLSTATGRVRGMLVLLAVLGVALFVPPVRASAQPGAKPCETLVGGKYVDHLTGHPLATASCLPLLTAQLTGNIDYGTSGRHGSATLHLLPALDTTTQIVAHGYDVEFVPGDGSYTAESTGACSGGASGDVSDLYGTTYDPSKPSGGTFYTSVLYDKYAWLSDPFGVFGFHLGNVHWPEPCSDANGDTGTGDAGVGFTPENSPAHCSHLKESGHLAAGPTITYEWTCDTGAGYTYMGSMSYNEPPCQRKGTTNGEAYEKLLPSLRAGLMRLYELIDAHNGCYRFSSGYRDQKKVYDDWHRIADRHCSAQPVSAATVDSELHNAGFAQNVLGCDGRVGRGGPCNPYRAGAHCTHSGGEAADIRWWWRPFGELPFKEPEGEFTKIFLPLMRDLVKQVGLCGPPTSDPVHVEVPMPAGSDKAKCSAFSRS